MIFSALAFACVLYTDGTEHCDVRTKASAQFNTEKDCNVYMARGIMKVADSAYDNEDVVEVTAQESHCYASYEELQRRVDFIPEWMKTNGRTFIITHY